MKSGFESNIDSIYEKFVELTHTEMTRAIKRAIRAGGNELVKQTKQNARNGIKKTGYGKNSLKYNDNVIDAPRLSKIEENRGEEMVQKVHVMGTRAKNSQTYKFRFLEKGTKPRYAKTIHGQLLKKKRYLGSIKPKWFFKDAQATVEPQLTTIYMREIQKALDKINNS